MRGFYTGTGIARPARMLVVAAGLVASASGLALAEGQPSTAPGSGEPAQSDSAGGGPPQGLQSIPGITIEPPRAPAGDGLGNDGAMPGCPLMNKRKLELIV